MHWNKSPRTCAEDFLDTVDFLFKRMNKVSEQTRLYVGVCNQTNIIHNPAESEICWAPIFNFLGHISEANCKMK